jgi:hypothetical protein
VSKDKKKGSDVVAYLIDGTDPPRETDKGEGGVDVERKLGGVSACAREKGDEAVNASDLVEHLRTGVSRAGEIGAVGSHRKEDNKSGTSLEIEKTKHGSKRTGPELLLKSKFHGGHM